MQLIRFAAHSVLFMRLAYMRFAALPLMRTKTLIESYKVGVCKVNHTMFTNKSRLFMSKFNLSG